MVRIGMDLEPIALGKVIQAYDLPTVVANADLTQGTYLPFGSKTFDRVEIYFPHNEPLYGLCGRDKGILWNELERVLKDNGIMEIVIDVPHLSQIIGIWVSHNPVIIQYPQEEVFYAGKQNGFAVQINRMEDAEIRSIGTHFSEFALAGQGFDQMDVYKIIAKKTKKDKDLSMT